MRQSQAESRIAIHRDLQTTRRPAGATRWSGTTAVVSDQSCGTGSREGAGSKSVHTQSPTSLNKLATGDSDSRQSGHLVHCRGPELAGESVNATRLSHLWPHAYVR